MTKTDLEIKDKSKDAEGIKIAQFRQHIRKTSPHKHNNYFEIIYLTKGKGTHTIDTKEYEIKPPVIFTIRKEQVHFWDIKTKPDGYVLLIKKSFIEECIDKDIKRLISELSSENCLFPNDHIVTELFKILLIEHQANKASKRIVIEGLLKALFAKLIESTTLDFSKSGNSNVFQKFIELLNRENDLKNKVNHYAHLLNTTPQNLNAICRKEKGQAAANILAEHIINEAKRLLLYTDYTVSQIAYRLDFKDNSHFTKYFKRHVNQSPNEFRMTNN